MPENPTNQSGDLGSVEFPFITIIPSSIEGSNRLLKIIHVQWDRVKKNKS